MGIKLFISYAHEDESFRIDFEKHFTSMKREGLIEEWTDRMISAGSEWAEEIEAHLDQSNIILLFISPDFMASSYCSEVEVQRAMQRQRMGISKVIPVLIRPADWLGAPFSKLQAIPSEARAISEWEDRDAAMFDVTKHLRKLCKEVSAIPGNPANPYTISKTGDWIEAELIYDLHQTGESKIATLHMSVIDKNDDTATVKVLTFSEELGNDEKTIGIPLDKPLEDSAGLIASSFTSEQIPGNASIEVHQNSGGVEKLFIGSKVYYTTWVNIDCDIRMGKEHTVLKTRKWLSELIPLDGIVKLINTIEGIYTSTMTVIAYGHEDTLVIPEIKSNNVKSKARQKKKIPALGEIIGGSWQTKIIESSGQIIPATFSFNSPDVFTGTLDSASLGPIHLQGRWWVQNQNLFFEGSQAYSTYNMPYAAGIEFVELSKNILKGISQSGEKVIMERIK